MHQCIPAAKAFILLLPLPPLPLMESKPQDRLRSGCVGVESSAAAALWLLLPHGRRMGASIWHQVLPPGPPHRARVLPCPLGHLCSSALHLTSAWLMPQLCSRAPDHGPRQTSGAALHGWSTRRAWPFLASASDGGLLSNCSLQCSTWGTTGERHPPEAKGLRSCPRGSL